MKLYEVPRNSRVKVKHTIAVPPLAPDITEEEVINFHHVDGMYSYCTKDDGTVCHLAAFTEVEIVKEDS